MASPFLFFTNNWKSPPTFLRKVSQNSKSCEWLLIWNFFSSEKDYFVPLVKTYERWLGKSYIDLSGNLHTQGRNAGRYLELNDIVFIFLECDWLYDLRHSNLVDVVMGLKSDPGVFQKPQIGGLFIIEDK